MIEIEDNQPAKDQPAKENPPCNKHIIISSVQCKNAPFTMKLHRCWGLYGAFSNRTYDIDIHVSQSFFLGESGLLRLFYSDLFDASMALQYLFKSRDSGILQFLGNRLFELSKVDLDFYLPQLLILYLYTEEPTRNCIHPYLVGRYVWAV